MKDILRLLSWEKVFRTCQAPDSDTAVRDTGILEAFQSCPIHPADCISPHQAALPRRRIGLVRDAGLAACFF
jgi:hypothetical protein